MWEGKIYKGFKAEKCFYNREYLEAYLQLEINNANVVYKAYKCLWNIHPINNRNLNGFMKNIVHP